MADAKSGGNDARLERSHAEKLVDLVSQHVNAERKSIRRYEALATDTALGSDIRFLISLIIADEVRHHGYLQALTGALKREVELQTVEGSLPTMTWRMDPGKRNECLTATEELLAIERSDLRELRQLRRELRPFSDATLWDIVVSCMESDTQKHLEILDFLKRHLKELAP